jgi:hypothetical protein
LSNNLGKRDIEDMVNIVRRKVGEIENASLALKEAALLTAQSGKAALARIGGERMVEIKSETSIYSILLGARIDRARAMDICLRNGIENMNRVVGTIFLPQEDF